MEKDKEKLGAAGRNRSRPRRSSPAKNTISHDGRRKIFSATHAITKKFADEKTSRMRENVRILRTSLGWSQSHLADLCGWSRTTIVRLETGDCCPSYGQMCVLAKSLNVSLATLGEDLTWIFAANNGGTLGEELRRRRVAMNLTQQEVAEKCGMTRLQFQAIESETRIPSPDELAKLASLLGESLTFAA